MFHFFYVTQTDKSYGKTRNYASKCALLMISKRVFAKNIVFSAFLSEKRVLYALKFALLYP